MNDYDKLNQLGKEWYNMLKQGNEAAQLALYEEIFDLVDKLFSGRRDALRLFFEKDWHKFDPRKKGLYSFINFWVNMRTIDLLGEKWYNMAEQGNEAVRLALREKIFVLAYELFPRQSDAMGLFFEKDWDKFDPEKGDLSGFISFRLKRRMTDLGRQDTSGDDSLDEPVSPSEDGGPTKSPEIPSPESDLESDVMLDATVMELMTLMLDLKSRLGSRAGNPVRINYFRLFFTDGVVDAIHCQGANAFVRRERDLFRVIKESFLNYFMGSFCGSVEEILSTDLKLYGQMVKGRPMEPPGQPLPNDVYMTYLKQVEDYTAGDSAVSQQRTAYKKFIRAQLSC